MQRSNGRSTTQSRPVTITRRYLRHAHGSCLFELGDTKVLCAATFADTVAGWRRGSGLGWVTAEYSLLPASTHTRTRREVAAGAPSGRTHEIQRLIGRSLRAAMGTMTFGEYTIKVDCDVLTAGVVGKIREFQKRGGIVIGDGRLCPAIRADVPLPVYERTRKAAEDRSALVAAADAPAAWTTRPTAA